MAKPGQISDSGSNSDKKSIVLHLMDTITEEGQITEGWGDKGGNYYNGTTGDQNLRTSKF